MAIRDHFRLDVLVRRAAELQEADAELGEVERLLAAAAEGVGGACRSCGSPHSRGAAYCWKCGQPLMLEVPVAATPEPAPERRRGQAAASSAPGREHEDRRRPEARLEPLPLVEQARRAPSRRAARTALAM